MVWKNIFLYYYLYLMRNKERVIISFQILYFQKKILHWYRTNGRKFPWRENNRSCYQKIFAELLLQRTKAETVAKHYPALIMKYQSWEDLANAQIIEIEQDLHPLGLYKQRALRLSLLAHEMVKLGGMFPENTKDLIELPFIGDYQCNAIRLLCFGKREPLVDVNMVRIIERFFRERLLVDYRYDPKIQFIARRIVSHKKAKEINFGVIDFAAKVCTKNRPKCVLCDLHHRCMYFREMSNQ